MASPDVVPIDPIKRDRKEYKCPTGFKINGGSLYVEVKKDGDEEPTEQWVGDALYVKARTHDERNGNWGFYLEFDDAAKNVHTWAMPAEMLSGSGEEYRRELLYQGYSIAPGTKSRNHLTEYIQRAVTDRKVLCTDRTGWHGETFVMPVESFGAQDVVYQTPMMDAAHYGQRGSLMEWRDKISAACVGNSRLLFCASVAFAGPLMNLLNEENGGTHIQGDSSEGKTTAQRVAASVWGSPAPGQFMKSWRATDNGLEAVAAAHSGTVLILDEMGEVDGRVAGHIAYMLANGVGKHRASRTGGTRRQHSWQLQFLSSGEIDLAQHMAASGKRVRAGQEVRLLSIPADAGAGYGLFEYLHEYDSAAKFADALKNFSESTYGTAGPAFIEKLCEDIEGNRTLAKALKWRFLEDCGDYGQCGQVQRAAQRFALIAAAGELAARFGITVWDDGEVSEAVRKCFKAWLGERGGPGNKEDDQIIAQVTLFLEQHGDSRFGSFDESTVVRDRAGFRRFDDKGVATFYVLPETFKQEVAKGYKPARVIEAMRRYGMLAHHDDGKNQVTERLPGMGPTKCYALKFSQVTEKQR